MFGCTCFSWIRTVFVLATVVAAGVAAADEVPDPPLEPAPASLEEADAYFAEGSFALARDAYAALKKDGGLAPAERGHVRFRLLESGLLARAEADGWPYWRGLTEEDRRDFEALEELAREAWESGRGPGREWAAMRAALGWLWIDVAGDEERAQAAFRDALDFHAGSSDLAAAREGFLGTVFTLAAAGPDGLRVSPRFGRVGKRVWLEDAARIAESDEDRARASLLLADHRQRFEADNRSRQRAGDALAAAVAAGEGTALETAALFARAEWLARYGHSRYTARGRLVLEPDFGAAVDVYTKLLETAAELPEPRRDVFRRRGPDRRDFGTAGRAGRPAALKDRAREALERIREAELSAAVTHTFKPDAQVHFTVGRRNIEVVEARLWRTSVEKLGRANPDELDLSALVDEGAEPLWTRRLTTAPERPHLSVDERVVVPDSLAAGAYLVEVRGGGRSVVRLLLVTEAALVAHAADRVLLIAVDSATGEPVPEAEFALTFFWAERADGRVETRRESMSARADADGMAIIERPEVPRRARMFAVADTALGPVVLRSMLAAGPWWSAPESAGTRAHVYADRPLYRPGETVRWRAVFRELRDGAFHLPETAAYTYEIRDYRGDAVAEGTVEPSKFGTAHGTLELPAEARPGAYGIVLREDGAVLRSAQLFAVEVFRVPEFEVAVVFEGAESDVGTPAFPLGETVTGRVDVSYFAGGPVGDAEVEIRVDRMQRSHFPWLAAETAGMDRAVRGGLPGGSARVEFLTLRTDARGTVAFEIPTHLEDDADFEYMLDVAVRDASGRETRKTASFLATRQPYDVSLRAERSLLRPGDRARLHVEATDANGRGVEIGGRLTVVRERWRQVYIHQRRGNEISGDEFRALPERSLLGSARSDYQLKEEGFVTETIDEVTLTTSTDGRALYSLETPEPGYYRATWVSEGRRGLPVTAETVFWVTPEGDSRIGYRPSGVQLHFDDRVYRAGEQVPVLITTEAPNRTVLLIRGEDDIRGWQVVRMSGNARLLLLDTKVADSPTLGLTATMVHGDTVYGDSRRVRVEKTERRLDIDVAFDARTYAPRAAATATLRVRDEEGNPVQAELSFGLADDAVFSLMPRRFPGIAETFSIEERHIRLRTVNSFQWQPVFRPGEGAPPEGTEARADPRRADDVFALSPFTVDAAAEEGYYAARTESAPALAFAARAEDVAAEPMLRTDFQSTVAWFPDIVTDEAGEAEVSWTFPDNLTRWRATYTGVSGADRWAEGSTSVVTQLPLIVRLLPPRFLVAGDRSVITALVTNNSPREREVSATARIEGALVLDGDAGKTLVIPGGETRRVTWAVDASAPGEATVRVTARGGNAADSVSLKVPVHPYGVEHYSGFAGRTEGGRVRAEVNLPANRRPETTEVTVTVSPSVATSVLDALPFLIEFPYGCVEQTASRFFPAAVVAHSLQSLGFSAASVRAGIFGGIDPARLPENNTGLGKLDAVVAAGLARLADAQEPSGAWPWMPGGRPDTHVTAYVLWALETARHAGIEVDGAMVERARMWLEAEMNRIDNRPQLRTWILHALSSRYEATEAGRPTPREATAFLELMRERAGLGAYGKAMLALVAARFGFEEDARLLLRNLHTSVRIEEHPDASALTAAGTRGTLRTAHWGRSREWWNWWRSPVEATSFALQAMLVVDPANELVVPAMNWLTRNRTAARWDHTRDTAVAVLALTDYLRLSGELESDLDVEIRVNGEYLRRVSIPLARVLEGARATTVPAGLLRDGTNTVEIIRRSGDGPVYYRVDTKTHIESPPVEPAGSELFVMREFYRVREIPTLLRGFRDRLEPLENGGAVVAGERVEVVLLLEAKADLEYLVVEDFRAAGMETVQIFSGERIAAREVDPVLYAEMSPDERARGVTGGATARNPYLGRTVGTYQEIHERGGVFFIDRLPEGTWELRYRLRAETPGAFEVLPGRASAMYVPRIRGNSASAAVRIAERDAGQ
ncbi:MAG: hypothetical protein JJU00_06835 [Opitutales bacterium]|nr:hypothetical protein [Opitutales bacterium]